MAKDVAARHGWLLRRDYPEARRWLRKAKRLGSEAAKGLLWDV